MDQAASDYVLAVRVLHTGSIIMTHAVALSLERKCLRHRLAEPLADEVEGMDHLGSTRIDVYLAPHRRTSPCRR